MTQSTLPSIAESIFFNAPVDENVVDFVPASFAQYIGQEALIERLVVYTQAALQRKEALDHVLLFGPPGLGKTTLAQIIAHEMGAQLKISSGPVLQKSGDVVAILSSLQAKDVLFIDEIHRLPIAVEETLYSAMEQFKIDVIIGQGVGAKTLTLPLQPFTLIGATTKTGLLSAPLRSRFGIIEKFDFYTDLALSCIVQQSAHFFGISLSKEAALRIAACSRGTPRLAKKLMRRIRDYVQINHAGQAAETSVQEALTFFGVLHEGLTYVDLALLRALYQRPHFAPLGLEALAALVGEDAETLEDVYEPFLINRGYIERTPRGRIISPKRAMDVGRLLQ